MHIYILYPMHRTSILLPLELKRKAELEAGKKGISLGEMIRRGLKSDIDGSRHQSTVIPAFFQRQPWGKKTPVDLSAHHDDYLYGESA